MIRTVLIFIALACALPAPCIAAAIDVPALVVAIRQVEGYRGQDGAAGERGPYQLTRAVWVQHMPGRSYTEARQEGPARACALKHIAWLRRELRGAGLDDTPQLVAIAWNAGLEATLRGRAGDRSRDYAQRVANLYGEDRR